jgi:hypothetical protein
MARTYPIAVVALAFITFGCGGGDAGGGAPDDAESAPAAQPVTPAAPAPAPEMPAMGEATRPEWFVVDEAANSVHITLTAGATPVKNYWNYNGYHDGNAALTVPEGYSVTIDLVNADPAMPHSVGVSELSVRTSPAPVPEPVFAGAVTPNATSMTDGTMPGQTQTIHFTAERGGTYALMCYVPGHAATGMWLYFVVSTDGTSAGFSEAL